MGNIVLKDVGQYYPKDKDIKDLLKYIAGQNDWKEEVRYLDGKGVARKPQQAAEQMIKLQKYYKKDKGTGKCKVNRRVYHLICSFPSAMEDANYVKLVAENVAELFGRTYQVYYGVHEDTDNLHIHFAVNAVSHVNGKKWHYSKKEFRDLESCVSNIAKELL